MQTKHEKHSSLPNDVYSTQILFCVQESEVIHDTTYTLNHTCAGTHTITLNSMLQVDTVDMPYLLDKCQIFRFLREVI